MFKVIAICAAAMLAAISADCRAQTGPQISFGGSVSGCHQLQMRDPVLGASVALGCSSSSGFRPAGIPTVYFDAWGGSPAIGSAANTAAVQALTGAGGPCQYGCRLVFGNGVYAMGAMGTLSGIVVEGQSEYSTIIQDTTVGGTLATLGAASSFRNLTIAASPTKTAGSTLVINGNLSGIEHVTMVGYFVGVTVNNASLVVYPYATSSTFRSPAIGAGSCALRFLNYANAVISRNIISGPASGQQPDCGMEFQNGDTAIVSDNNITLHGRALVIDPGAGQNNYAFSATNSLFDSAGTISGGVAADAALIAPAGNVYNARFNGDWFGLSANDGLKVVPTGSGTVNGLEVISAQAMGNAANGIEVGGAVVNWQLVYGQYGGQTNGSAVIVQPGTQNGEVVGALASNVANRGANKNGIVLTGGGFTSNLWVHGNKLYGSTTADLTNGMSTSQATVETNRCTSSAC